MRCICDLNKCLVFQIPDRQKSETQLSRVLAFNKYGVCMVYMTGGNCSQLVKTEHAISEECIGTTKVPLEFFGEGEVLVGRMN
eukprot:scaffold23394_cov42-Cyclotella_meneghiniana.AAC.2